jgi:acetyl esterase/lipase
VKSPASCGGAGPAHPVDVRVLTIKGPAGPLAARLYRAKGAAGLADTLLVFFHAGGFVSGSLEASDPCLRALAGHVDAAVLAPAYAQAPDQPFPAAAEDAYAAIADCAAHPRRYQWTGRTLVVGGVEAGGNLAAVATLMARDRGGPPLAGQMLITPMLDPGLSSTSMRCAAGNDSGEQIASACAEGYREYLPRAGDRVHPYACPLASTRLKGLPPTLMVSIAGDPLRDEANAYVAKLQAASVPVRTLEMRTPAEAGSLVDANERCRSSSDADAYAVMAAFIASVANDAA